MYVRVRARVDVCQRIVARPLVGDAPVHEAHHGHAIVEYVQRRYSEELLGVVHSLDDVAEGGAGHDHPFE